MTAAHAGAASATLKDLVDTRQILICVGAGGVGKTTSAAALALLGAFAGRKTLVITIDPARRLANALGLESLGHDIRRVETERLATACGRTPTGSLDAMMLDQKRAFDEIVDRYAKDEAARKAIYDNPIYQQISSRLAGSHEYAAMAKVYELYESKKYDLIVLDTPPTANALNFLDAPERLSEAVDSPTIQWMVKPYLAAGKFSLRALSFGASFILSRISRFTGGEFLEQVARFFIDFNQILGGFRKRAQVVSEVLRGPTVAYVIVSSPEVLAIDEAVYFSQRLVAQGMKAAAFIVNRVHRAENYGESATQLSGRVAAHPELKLSAEELAHFSESLYAAYQDYERLVVNDRAQINRLTQTVSGAALALVPFFDRDVYDMAGLWQVSERIVAPPPTA